MPALSKSQQALMAIAEHSPSKVRAGNRGVLKMSKSQLHDYASTSTSKLPASVTKASSKILAGRSRKPGTKKY
jgi:hypothetical protein